MIKKSISFILFLSMVFLFFPQSVQAKSGCCSGHGGVSCSAGAQGNGDVICNDAWTGSSCSYSEMAMCEGSSAPKIMDVPAEVVRPLEPAPIKKVVVLTQEQQCEVTQKLMTARIRTQERLKEQSLTRLNGLVTQLESQKDTQVHQGLNSASPTAKVLSISGSIASYQHAYDEYTNAMYTTLYAACSANPSELRVLRKNELTLSKKLVPLKQLVLRKKSDALNLKNLQ